jgi:phage FluMu protein gp41
MEFMTEYEFELPKGYVDEAGTLHKKGIMRLATAADEILPLRDPKVQQNPSYLTIVLLSRVVTQIGSITTINTKTIEKLFTADLQYLQNMYQMINGADAPVMKVACPHCGETHEVPINFTQEG